MTSSSSPREQAPEHFSWSLFLLTIALTIAVLGAAFRFIAPAAWRAQGQAPLWGFAVAFAAISLLNCFLEFFFHRYVLHRPAIPGLSRLYRQHTLHHALTRISRKPSRDGRDLLFVENKFPIVEPEQGEGSFFPWYALAAFAALLTPLLVLLQWLLPAAPWFLGGIAALTSSLMLYEGLHAINHWPLERWTRLIDHPRWGRFWRRAYSFHLRHHAVIDCNESVSGFFGLPLADWLFRTCVIPPTIYADGEAWRSENFTAPRPRGLIRWLDRCAAQAIAARRSQELPARSAGARTYTRGEEIANWLTHGVGAALSLAGLTILIVFASLRTDAWHVVSVTVFGLSLLALYLVSTLHHLARSPQRRLLLRRLDHAALFLLIVGTGLPFFLSAVTPTALWLLLAGGVCYAMGVPFYLWRRLRYHHAFWHGFVLGGSACHFLAVLFLLGPAHP